MRWERGDEPVTWTTIDNVAIDADLSDRALGMLVRWLRRPPGVEIDGIPERVKRAKRNGKTRLEGRDAQYAASHELEAEGFLVRELTTNEAGQHEWVVRIYSRPVAPDKRSSPEGRKRAPKRTRSAKSQVSPNTGFQEPGNQEPGFQETGNQETGSQEASLQYSGNDSSLSSVGVEPAGGSGTEREIAPPKTDTEPAGGPAVAGAEVPGQREGSDQSAAAAGGRIVVAYAAALGRPVLNGTRAKLQAQAAELLAAGLPEGWLCDRARELAANGWTDLAQHAERSKVPVPSSTAAGRLGLPEWCGQCAGGSDFMGEPVNPAARFNPRFRVMDGEKCPHCHPERASASV
ncbi:hypothetical protein [Streptomyces antarcticus]|uniref:hypothetical protein n=1 Tax=Streptomyces antarcticus TaxID=2996458 RepID=UPI00226F3997|nr:hypothetical protein [Streptomyces sp. H34-AA3]MCY0947856.1 hypothetical protein [Streptomyces sp. H34-AA3]